MARIVKTSISAITKLFTVIALAGAFIVGLIGVVYLSLRGAEVKVPEVVGKNFAESEREMADLGLKLKRRATRYSQEAPNTVLEQLPRAGDTVKTGQTILVVLSEANPEGSEAPATIQKDDSAAQNTEADENTDITPDKSVKANKNANVKKPAQTTRDTLTVKSNKNSNASVSAANTSAGNTTLTNAKTSASDNKNAVKNGTTPAGNKSVSPANSNRSEPVKPNPAKPPAAKTPVTNGDTRTRRVPQP